MVSDRIIAMHNLVRTSQLLALVCVAWSSMILAQVPTKRSLHVTITDSKGRTVIGLDRTDVGVVEDGSRRRITEFKELRDEYVIEFETANQSGEVKIVIDQSRGLPPLRVNVKQ